MMERLREILVYLVLLKLKYLSRVFYRHELGWVGEVPEDPWGGIRLVAILNHTSLFEFLFAGIAPNRFLLQVARHGVVPAADKTLRRPLLGTFFRLIARQVVAVSRERDHTWDDVLRRIDPEALVALLPEGRMKRANGLDLEGRPMTVRGGIADILGAIPEGRMLLAYSGGLHHVQIPGQGLPRLFKTLRMRLEVLDIRAYREELLARSGLAGFKRAVIADLERRRDLYCPVLG